MNFDPWKCSTGLWTRRGGIDFRHPTTDMIFLEDIAEALSRTCRWNGHVPISVAEHSYNVYVECEDRDGVHALLHDAAEAYLGDIPTPLKRMMSVGIEPFVDVEERILRTIYGTLGVKYDQEALDRVLQVERKLLVSELALDPDREINPRKWAGIWKRGVINAIQISGLSDQG